MALRSDYYTPLVEMSDDQLVARFHDGDGDALAAPCEPGAPVRRSSFF